MEFTASIVLYNTNSETLNLAIESYFRYNYNTKLFLIDNSLVDLFRYLSFDNRIIYIHNPSNPGFGAAHNIAIKSALKIGSKYHFIINPDIHFWEDVIKPMIGYMESNNNVGMLMPEVLNPDGTIQYLPKLLPTPLNIVLRKLKYPRVFYKRFINKYEIRFAPKCTIYKAPLLSGCFTLLRLEAINLVGAYNEEFFMYFEDWDLSRRIGEKFDTVYFPKVSIYHNYDSGANKSVYLFRIYLKSAILYFNKWGWIFDKNRRRINAQALAQFK